jgi:mannose-6-phosphate isomerase class I
MNLAGRPTAIDWANVAASRQQGKSGAATAHVRQFGEVQLRLMSYSPDYVADHWCHKGHVVFVVDGQLEIEHQDGKRYELQAGMSYFVGDNEASPHRVTTRHGASIFVVD